MGGDTAGSLFFCFYYSFILGRRAGRQCCDEWIAGGDFLRWVSREWKKIRDWDYLFILSFSWDEREWWVEYRVLFPT